MREIVLGQTFCCSRGMPHGPNHKQLVKEILDEFPQLHGKLRFKDGSLFVDTKGNIGRVKEIVAKHKPYDVFVSSKVKQRFTRSELMANPTIPLAPPAAQKQSQHTGFLSTMSQAFVELDNEIKTQLASIAKAAEEAKSEIKLAVDSVRQDAASQIAETIKQAKEFMATFESKHSGQLEKMNAQVKTELNQFRTAFDSKMGIFETRLNEIDNKISRLDEKVTAAGKHLLGE